MYPVTSLPRIPRHVPCYLLATHSETSAIGQFSQSTGHIIAAAPLEIVAMDFTKLEPATDGREDVLVCTDVFTKWTIAVPTRDQTARTVAKVLIEEWIPHYGVPHSDQGKSFDATIIR